MGGWWLAGIGNWESPLSKNSPCPGCSGVETGSPEHSFQKDSQAVGITGREASLSACSGFLRATVRSQKARS